MTSCEAALSDPFFDTNIIIDWLLEREPARVELRRYRHRRISRVVWAEVLAGEPLDRREMVADVIGAFEVTEVDERVAAAAVEIRYRTRIKMLDAFILATAQVHGAILISRNTRDFPVGTPGVHVPYTL